MTPPTPDLTPTEARVLAAIDMDGLLDTISRLVAIPTDQGRETPAQEQMAEWMAQAGMNVDVWEIDFEELAAPPPLQRRDRARTIAGGGGVARRRGRLARRHRPAGGPKPRAAPSSSTDTSMSFPRATCPGGRSLPGRAPSATATLWDAARWT